MRTLLSVLAIELGIMLGMYTADVLAQEHKVTLHGKLFSMESDDYCMFMLDPEGESEGIQRLAFSNDSYLCDYLKGSEARDFIIVMGPAK